MSEVSQEPDCGAPAGLLVSDVDVASFCRSSVSWITDANLKSLQFCVLDQMYEQAADHNSNLRK